MLTCAILDDTMELALKSADWSVLFDQVQLKVYQQPLGEQLSEALSDCAIICLMRERTPFPGCLIRSLPQLRLLVTSGMRNQSIDLAVAGQAGVTVCGTQAAGHPAAELAFGLMLELARKVGLENARLQQGCPWQSTTGVQLLGKTLALLGFGKLGQKMAEFGKAFGMRVVAWSENLRPDVCSQFGVEWVDSQQLFAQADFLSVHLQLSERTRGLVHAGRLALMKPGAYLINTSRGPILDSPALLEALHQGRLAGAALDVFDEEPLPLDHPFRSTPNLVITPHLGYATQENFALYYSGMVEAIQAWLAGQPIRVLA